MKNRIILLAGQTGVGKSDIAHRLAKQLNGEVILIDTMQLYKGLNILANKPSILLTNSVKYHNINEYDFNPNIILNANNLVEKIRFFIKDIWSRGKLPILEGGSGFHFKILLTGNSKKFSPDEEIQFEKNKIIAREIIKYDNDFDISFERLMRIDNSVPRDLRIRNDLYRLENKMAEAMILGNGAYKLLRVREEKIRKENYFLNDVSIYNFFLHLNKFELWTNLENRCERMIECGVIEEVTGLIENKTIRSEMFNCKLQSVNNSYSFLNCLGLRETIHLLLKLLDYANKKHDIILSYSSNNRDFKKNNLRKELEKIYYNYLNDFAISHKKYARYQLKWFKNSENYLWINTYDGEEKISNLIKDKYLHISEEEFKNQLESNENKLLKENYKNEGQGARDCDVKPTKNFSIIEDKKKFVTILERSFNCLDKISDELIKIKDRLDDKNNDNEKTNPSTEDSKKQKIEIFDKFINM